MSDFEHRDPIENKNALFEMYTSLRYETQNKWDRVLPFAENITDRWEKARFLGFGEGTSVYDSSIIMGNVTVGSNTWIGPWTLLDGSGSELTIGSYCSISAGVQIYTHNTVKKMLSGGVFETEVGKVAIGNNCYIAPMCIISMNVQIGDRSVVCANSFVNKSFPSNSIIAGTPAKKIGEIIFDENNSPSFYYYKHNENDSDMKL